MDIYISIVFKLSIIITRYFPCSSRNIHNYSWLIHLQFYVVTPVLSTEPLYCSLATSYTYLTSWTLWWLAMPEMDIKNQYDHKTRVLKCSVYYMYYFLHLLVHVMFCLVIFKIKFKYHLYWRECNYY